MAKFGIQPESLRLLRHEHNTTFRVDSKEGRFALRINRPGVHGLETIGSEMAWLLALNRDTDLGVPKPVQAANDSLVVTLETDGGPRYAVLMQWQEGRFYDKGIKPVHLRRIGRLEAQLHSHASHWTRPDGFMRPRLDVLSTSGRVASIGSSPAAEGLIPTETDAQIAIDLVTELLSSDEARICQRAVETARAATAEARGQSMLIHGDLHYENVLFDCGRARAIDFDDCGWGYPVYDLAVTLWELEDRPGYPELRRALFEGYSESHALPANPEETVSRLFILRKLQILMWILESRTHTAFRNSWQEWAREEVQSIEKALSREPPPGR